MGRGSCCTGGGGGGVGTVVVVVTVVLLEVFFSMCCNSCDVCFVVQLRRTRLEGRSASSCDCGVGVEEQGFESVLLLVLLLLESF